MQNNNDQYIYPIGVVAKMLNISVPTIRLYEREGLIVLRKTASGHRIFCDFDIDRLKCIRKMIVGEGLNIQGIKKLMAMIPCWKLKQECTAEHQLNCPAYHRVKGPCWSLENKPSFCNVENCHPCPVYRQPFHCDELKSYLHTQDLVSIKIS